MSDKSDRSNITGLRPSRPCVMCEKPSVREFHPFCSKRCADLDLGKWLNGSYAIPVVEEDGAQLDDYSEEFDS